MTSHYTAVYKCNIMKYSTCKDANPDHSRETAMKSQKMHIETQMPSDISLYSKSLCLNVKSTSF